MATTKQPRVAGFVKQSDTGAIMYRPTEGAELEPTVIDPDRYGPVYVHLTTGAMLNTSIQQPLVEHVETTTDKAALKELRDRNKRLQQELEQAQRDALAAQTERITGEQSAGRQQTVQTATGTADAGAPSGQE